MKIIAFILVFTFSSPALAQWYIGGKSGATFSYFKTNVNWNEVPKAGFFAGASAFKQLGPKFGLGI